MGDWAMRTEGERYSAEVREPAVRLVLEHGGEYQTELAAITSISQKCGMTAEPLRKWVAKEILKAASAFFARELDLQPKR